MFEGQPKGLYALALANTGERFGYYTMLAIFVLFLKANFGLSAGVAGTIYSTFLALVYRRYLGRQVWLWKDGDDRYCSHVCRLCIVGLAIGQRDIRIDMHVCCVVGNQYRHRIV